MLPFQAQVSDMEVCMCFLRVTNVKLPLVNLRKAIWTQYCCVKSPTASLMLDRFITITKRLTKTHQFTKMCYFIGDPDDSGLQQVRITHLRFYMRKQNPTKKQICPETSLTTSDLNLKISRDLYFRFEKYGRVTLKRSAQTLHKLRITSIEFRLSDKMESTLNMSIQRGDYGGSRMSWPRFYVSQNSFQLTLSSFSGCRNSHFKQLLGYVLVHKYQRKYPRV